MACFAFAQLWLGTVPVLAQELRLSSASGAPGQTVSIRVDVISPAGKEPSALEWEMRAPNGQLAPEVELAAAEKRTARAGKTLHCAARDGGILCIISGGREKIANGPVAKLTFRIPADALAGDAQIRVVGGAAVTGDSRRTAIPAAESWVAIRRR